MTAIDFNQRIVALSTTLKSFTHHFTSDMEESLDLVQETILRALRYKARFKEDTNLKGWLFTIMRNIFINNYRKNKNHKIIHDESTERYFLNQSGNDGVQSPETTLSFLELWAEVNRLKPEIATPFTLHIEGFKYFEIAKQLNIPIGTVKSRIFQARKEIQRKIERY